MRKIGKIYIFYLHKKRAEDRKNVMTCYTGKLPSSADAEAASAESKETSEEEHKIALLTARVQELEKELAALKDA